MKALLVLVSLGLFSSLSFAAQSIGDLNIGTQMGQTLVQTGGEFCNGNGKQPSVKGAKPRVIPGVISN